jgi:hypothetical protein
MRAVDALLMQARELLGSYTAPSAPASAPASSLPSPGRWGGGAAEAATAASERLDGHQTHLRVTHTAAGAVIEHAAHISREAHTQLRAVEVAWSNDKAAIGPFANTPTGQAALLQAGQQRVQEATAVVQSAAERFHGAAEQIRTLTGQLQPGETSTLDFGGPPQSPPPQDPPHGEDRRYWLDLDKIVRVEDGELAPYGYTQIGPNLFHPRGDGGLPAPNPLDPATHPLDVADIVTRGPHELGPYGYQELAPGVFAPDPDGLTVKPPWPAPHQPVDIRDVLEVPDGQLAPRGYIEYLPGWWAPASR